ncbi:MAG: coproporphyrinogen III oxidase, partial [Mobilitalea sp.]
MEEYMFLGLRMCQGVSKKVFLDKFGNDIEEIYPKVLQQLIDNKLLICQEDMLFLSEYGIDVSNTVLSLFLLS